MSTLLKTSAMPGVDISAIKIDVTIALNFVLLHLYFRHLPHYVPKCREQLEPLFKQHRL